MKRKKNRQGKRLDMDDRIQIEAGVRWKMSLGQIASLIGFDKSTVCRELKRNSDRVSGEKAPCRHRHLSLCNGCPRRAWCPREKAFYDHFSADRKASLIKSTSRAHTKIPEEGLRIVDEIVKDGVSKGQSLHHIYASDPKLRAVCSERTVRRLVYRGDISTKAYQVRRIPNKKVRLLPIV